MDPVNHLQEVLESVRDGRADAARAAQLAPGWSPARYPSFLDYLNACGALGHCTAGSNGVARGENAGTVTALSAGTPPAAGRSTAVSLDGVGDGSPPTLPYPPGGHSAPLPGRSAGGRYRPIRLHKTGGLGQVWLAHDTVLGRDVALKVVRPERAGRADLIARFLREARVTGCLEHPGIVPLYDLVEGGEAWGSGPCYVMRYVSGGTLAEAIAKYHARLPKNEATPLEFRTLLDAFVAVCRAVAFAHARGVLHRDLKGQNVVLGEFGEVFLVDWGLTKLTGRPADGDGLYAGDGADETAEGTISGTPAYMAPEVAAGGDATTASDVYGLGAMLYAILTGKAPVEGTTPKEVLEKIRSADPCPPHDVNPSTSRSLEAVCRKAMARDCTDRYSSAADLATDAQRWLADEPVTAYREPWPDRAARWARRHRPAVAATAMTLFTAVVALGVSTPLLVAEQSRTEVQKRVAEGERDRARASLDAADRVTLTMIEISERVLPPLDGSESARLELTQAAVNAFRLFAQQRPDSPEVRRGTAQLNRIEGNLLRVVGNVAGAERSFGVALDVLRNDEANSLKLAETLRDFAGLQARTGRLKESLVSLTAAQAIVTRLRAAAPGEVSFRRAAAMIHLERSDCENTLGLYDLAAASAAQSVALFDGLAGPKQPYDTLLRSAAFGCRATAERHLGKHVQALATVTEAIAAVTALTENHDYGFNPDDAWSLHGAIADERCRIWLASGNDRKSSAEEIYGSIAARFTDLSTRHGRAVDYRCRLANALISRGELRTKPAEAVADFEAAYKHLGKLVEDCPSIPEYRADLGRACLGLSRTATDREAAARFNEEGISALRAARTASPDDVEIQQSLAAATSAAKP